MKKPSLTCNSSLARGNAYIERGDFQRAAEHLALAAKPYPGNCWLHCALAECYERTGDFRKAIGQYNRALTLREEDAEVYSARGNAYSKIGEFQRTLRDYARALRIDRDCLGTYLFRSRTYLNMARYSGAIRELKVLDANHALDGEGCKEFGVAYDLSRLPEEAEQYYARAIGMGWKTKEIF